MKKPRSHDPEDIARAATLLFMVRSQMRSRLAQGKRLDPYKWLRIETLVYVRDHGSSMKEIARYLSITAPSATSIVNALVREGLVERTPDAKDKRVQRLRLSKKGRRALETAVARGMRLLAPLFSALSAAELSTLTDLLEAVSQS